MGLFILVFAASIIGCIIGLFAGKRIWLGFVSGLVLALIGFFILSGIHNASTAQAKLVDENSYELKPLNSLSGGTEDYYIVNDSLNGQLVLNFATTQTDGVNVSTVTGQVQGYEARVNEDVVDGAYFVRYDWVWEKSSWALPWTTTDGTAATYDFHVPAGTIFDKFSAKE